MSTDKRPPLLRLAQIFELLRTLTGEGQLNMAAAQSVLFIAMASGEYDSPMLPSGSDVARAIGMSQSNTSRLLAGLLGAEFPLIASDRDMNDGKSESFYLTTNGQRLLQKVMGLVYEDLDSNILSPLNLGTYGQAKYIEKNGNFGIKVLKRGESGLSLEIALVQKNILSAVRKWMIENRMESAMRIGAKAIILEFPSRNLAILFMCRWGIPIR